MGAAHSSTPPPANSRLGVVIGALCALLAVAVVLLGVLWARAGADPDAAGAAPPTAPATSSTPTPAATATPGSSAAPGTPQPASCNDLYSADMVAAFGPLVLNPPWLATAEPQMRVGANDPALKGVIDANDTLLCHWGKPEGPSDVGVTTNVVWVADEDRAAVEAHLRQRGDECYDEQGGVRCLSQGSNTAGYFGESNFLRDGLWLATAYVNAGPDGYTLDMVNKLWPEG